MPTITQISFTGSAEGSAGTSTTKTMQLQSKNNRITVASTDRVVQHSIVVADSTTDQVIPLGDLASVSFAYILSSEEITLRKDTAGTAEVRGVNPFYIEQFPTNATALYLSNASGSDASVDVILVGPAT